MAFVEDVDVYPMMQELLGCLCDEIARSELPAPCRCEVKPGAAYALDFGPTESSKGNGQAWVRLVAAGATFPGDVGDQQAPILLTTRCNAPAAYELEIGISRCVTLGTTVNQRYIPPTAEAEAADVRLQIADMAAMKRTVLCCLKDKLGDDVEIGLGIYQPIDIQGGVGGGTWQVFVRRS